MKEVIGILKQMNKKISLIENKELRKKLRKLSKEVHKATSEIYEKAIHDGKTGLYNNHFFQTVLEIELEKARRNQENLSIYMVDIDFFKKLNDTYGHLIGDELLIRLAKVIMKNIRKSDIASRFGGEEFIILLPKSCINKAKKFAVRLNSAIKKDPLLKKYNLTTSGGLTEYQKGDTPHGIMERADKGLYHAKNQGRDRFIIIN